MQITNSLLSGISNDPGFGQTPSKSPSRQAGQAQDQVQISASHRNWRAIRRKLSQLQRHSSGAYNVSPSQIANSILNDAML